MILACITAAPFLVLMLLIRADPKKLRQEDSVPAPTATHVDPFADHPAQCRCPHHR